MIRAKSKILFIIPPGFGDKVAAGEPAQINLMVDESDSSVAQAGKSAALMFSQSFSASLAQQRLAAISMSAQAARGELTSAQPLLYAISSFDASPVLASSASLAREASAISAGSGASLRESIIELQNSLGYLVDQNEVLGGFSPGDQAMAALQQLATGDSR